MFNAKFLLDALVSAGSQMTSQAGGQQGGMAGGLGGERFIFTFGK